jgi:hypothetical protein
VSRYRFVAAAGIAASIVVASIVVAKGVPGAAPCRGGFASDVRNGKVVCVHASERPPPGVDTSQRPSTDQLRERRFGGTKRAPEVAGSSGEATTASGGGSIACIGNGVDGNRIQAIYARASDVADRFSSVASLITQYAGDADYQIDVSAGQSDLGRRVRYVTSNCALSIAHVTLSPGGDDSFSAMRSELWAMGFNKSNRKYLVWVDAAVGICGLGEMYGDDSATQDNYNNYGPSFARVDAPCWGYAEAHEMLHTLGGVQDSAPHSTQAGHCVDENDTMCYVDTSGKALENDCPSMPSWQVDCHLDDYFNANPPPGSYLATHWDVANSSFLEGAAPLPPPPTISAAVPATFYAGVVAVVKAYPVVPPGRTYTVTWASSRSDCKFFYPSGTTNLYYCPVTAAGSGQVTAIVSDSLGMSGNAAKTYKLVIPAKRKPTILYIGLSRYSMPKGGTLAVYGKLIDAGTGVAIIGMPVGVYVHGTGSGSWVKLTTRTTDRYGLFTLIVKPTVTTYFTLVSSYTSTWGSDQSTTKKIAVY